MRSVLEAALQRLDPPKKPGDSARAHASDLHRNALTWHDKADQYQLDTNQEIQSRTMREFAGNLDKGITRQQPTDATTVRSEKARSQPRDRLGKFTVVSTVRIRNGQVRR